MRQALEEMYPPVPASLEEQVVVELDEAKYDLYHKDFSSAMQHAYKMAKKLHGITVDPKEIDDKVASGPRKPSEGKTNSYRLEGDKGSIQVQVYNKGGSKPFELNFYKEEVELDESVIDKVKEIDSKKSAAKIDGVMVDSFTASAISQIYDKVNDANKKKMEKLPIIKLANLAMKMMQKNDYVPEEVDLDEGTKQVLAHGGKGKYKVTKDGDKIEIKFGGKVVGTADFDRGADSFFVSIKGEKGQKSFDDAQAIADYFAKNKITEEVDLDEGKLGDQWQKGAKSVKSGSFELIRGKSGVHDIMKSGKKIGTFSYDDEGDNFVANMKGERGQLVGNDIDTLISNFKEEVDLDEDEFGKFQDYARLYGGGDEIYVVTQGKDASGGRGEHQQKVVGIAKDPNKAKKIRDAANKQNPKAKARIYGQMKRSQKTFKLKVGDPVSFEDSKNKLSFIEEVDLDEGKMSQLHQYIKDKKSAEEIAKMMKLDVKTVKSLMSSHHPEDVDESAASDARRAISKDKDFSRKDSADDDTDASADDVKGASKNIMMQMRKAQSLNGRFDVEFGDGKKVKIPAKMAMAVQSKYNKMRRPAEKEKFQAKVGKSYRDMLSALKEEVKPKKESVLDRIDRKIKEKNDG